MSSSLDESMDNILVRAGNRAGFGNRTSFLLAKGNFIHIMDRSVRIDLEQYRFILTSTIEQATNDNLY